MQSKSWATDICHYVRTLKRSFWLRHMHTKCNSVRLVKFSWISMRLPIFMPNWLFNELRYQLCVGRTELITQCSRPPMHINVIQYRGRHTLYLCVLDTKRYITSSFAYVTRRCFVETSVKCVLLFGLFLAGTMVNLIKRTESMKPNTSRNISCLQMNIQESTFLTFYCQMEENIQHYHLFVVDGGFLLNDKDTFSKNCT